MTNPFDLFLARLPRSVRASMGNIRIGWTLAYRRQFPHLRMLPDFVIIGAQRCGTTSLYNYMAQHPLVRPAVVKEISFFDREFARGFDWYTAHFPLRNNDRQTITGEATPEYIFNPLVPERVYSLLPTIKLIALLRHPVDRAYSAYHMSVRKHRETLPFAEAVEREAERLSGMVDNMMRDPAYLDRSYYHFSYVARGIYAGQLERWLRYFPRQQLLIINSDNFYSNTQPILDQVAAFLDVPTWQLKVFRPYGSWEYPPIEPSVRDQLVSFYRPHNKRLFQLLGVDFGWEQ